MKKHSGVFSILFMILLSSSAFAETYTYPDLIKRMTDLQQLANLPPTGEKTSLASSYDRASKYDAASDKYIEWGANVDGSGIIRKEGDDSVLMDVQGPGCIWRTWSATAGTGHVKIYLDGSTTAAVDLPFLGYFDGKTAPFNRPNIVYIPLSPHTVLTTTRRSHFKSRARSSVKKGGALTTNLPIRSFPRARLSPRSA